MFYRSIVERLARILGWRQAKPPEDKDRPSEVEIPMSKHFERDLENLQHELLSLSGNVEQMVVKANRALHDRNWELAQQVIDADNTIDLHEVRIEDECLKILALHQPVAVEVPERFGEGEADFQHARGRQPAMFQFGAQSVRGVGIGVLERWSV